MPNRPQHRRASPRSHAGRVGLTAARRTPGWSSGPAVRRRRRPRRRGRRRHEAAPAQGAFPAGGQRGRQRQAGGASRSRAGQVAAAKRRHEKPVARAFGYGIQHVRGRLADLHQPAKAIDLVGQLVHGAGRF
ncbi:hypothetical protein G6F59_017298 [Rhizopus arrhizus]|nr:hypothetical protein G6F59_017298 [Rhizopus arrhizus]